MLIPVVYYTKEHVAFTMSVNPEFVEMLMDRPLNLGDGNVDNSGAIIRMGIFDYHIDGVSANKIRSWGRGEST